MISIHISGRLGNQLFQFAFGKSVSKRFSSLLLIKNYKEFYIHKYFELGFTGKICRLITYKPFNFYRKLGDLFTRNLKDISVSNFESPSDCKVFDNVNYSGFFQSEEYFRGLDNVSNLFRIRKPYQKLFLDKYGSIFSNNKIIAVHIRLTDYKSHGNEEFGGQDLSLPLRFFEDELMKIENLNEYRVIFLSDDIESVKNHFHQKRNYFFENNSEIIDFQILLNADILILSNSTFSWWAAFLNNNAKKIIAPKYWLGYRVRKEYPSGIMTKKFEWRDIEVRV